MCRFRATFRKHCITSFQNKPFGSGVPVAGMMEGSNASTSNEI